MKVTQEKLPASRVGLEIEITPEMTKQAYEKALQKFTRSANIPGFRKGKVPRQVLVSQFGQGLKASAIEELIDDSLKEAIKQEKIDALGNFELRTSYEELFQNYEPGSPLTFSAVVDVPPTATLSQYQGLSVKAEEIVYEPSKVDEFLDGYRDRLAAQVPVEGRPAQEKDLAVVDFKGRLAEAAEGEDEPAEIPGGSAENFEIELVEGKFIPGFISGIIGMNVGETKEVEATFPDPYPQEDLAGKKSIFTITLKELKEKELPEVDDDFAQEISDFETLAELRESLEKRFSDEASDKTKTNKQEALLAELVKYLEVDLPETLVRRETDYMITQTAMQFSNQGMDVKQLFTPEVVNSLRDRSRPEAVTRIQRTMALGEIARLESISVDEAAIETRMAEILEDFKDEPNLDRDRLKEVVSEELLKGKIFEWLEANNTVELVPEGSLTVTESPEADAEEADAEIEAADAETEDAEPKKAKASKAKTAKSPEPAAEEATPEAAPAEDAEDTAAKSKTSTTRKKTAKSKTSKADE